MERSEPHSSPQARQVFAMSNRTRLPRILRMDGELTLSNAEERLAERARALAEWRTQAHRSAPSGSVNKKPATRPSPQPHKPRTTQ